MNTKKHYALRNKVSGKHASRTDQATLANKIKAKEISDSGRGGGIVDLLAPKTVEEEDELKKVEQFYEVVEVSKRKAFERAEVKKVVEEDNRFMVLLAESYLSSKRYSTHKSTSIKTFTRWICDELKDHNSQVCRLVLKHYPALYERQKPDWWERRIAARRKQLKAKEMSELKTES
jgi:hypothetical protein